MRLIREFCPDAAMLDTCPRFRRDLWREARAYSEDLESSSDGKSGKKTNKSRKKKATPNVTLGKPERPGGHGWGTTEAVLKAEVPGFIETVFHFNVEDVPAPELSDGRMYAVFEKTCKSNWNGDFTGDNGGEFGRESGILALASGQSAALEMAKSKMMDFFKFHSSAEYDYHATSAKSDSFYSVSTWPMKPESAYFCFYEDEVPELLFSGDVKSVLGLGHARPVYPDPVASTTLEGPSSLIQVVGLEGPPSIGLRATPFISLKAKVREAWDTEDGDEQPGSQYFLHGSCVDADGNPLCRGYWFGENENHEGGHYGRWCHTYLTWAEPVPFVPKGRTRGRTPVEQPTSASKTIALLSSQMEKLRSENARLNALRAVEVIDCTGQTVITTNESPPASGLKAMADAVAAVDAPKIKKERDAHESRAELLDTMVLPLEEQRRQLQALVTEAATALIAADVPTVELPDEQTPFFYSSHSWEAVQEVPWDPEKSEPMTLAEGIRWIQRNQERPKKRSRRQS